MIHLVFIAIYGRERTHNEPDGLSNQKLPWDFAEIRVFKTRISA